MRNPTLNEETFDRIGSVDSADASPMTLTGMVGKTAILLAIHIACAVFGWQNPNIGLAVATFLVGFGVSIAIYFKPVWAPFLAPIYAGIVGVGVGVVSVLTNESLAKTKYANAVPLAILGTMVTLAIMLGLYQSRIIKVTQTFRMVVSGATMAVMAMYLITLLIPAMQSWEIYNSGPIGIGFSLFVIVLAALRFTLNFDTIETGLKTRAPKYMEWYCGFGMLVTMIWLYLEILNLFRKLASNR